MEIARVFEKRETAKSDWSGRIGAATLSVDNKGRMALDGTELPDASVEYLLTFALQSLQDAYAGAESLDAAKAAWAKKRDRLIDGSIGVRAGGGGEEAHMPYVRNIIRKALGADNKAKYDAIPSDDQSARKEFLESLFAGLPEEKRDGVEAEAKRLLQIDIDAKKAAKAATAGLGL